MEPDLTKSLISTFTVEGQCEHILVHTEPTVILAKAICWQGSRRRNVGGNNVNEKEGPEEPESFMSSEILTSVLLRKFPIASSVVRM